MMKYEMSSYFEDPEFKESLAKYEGMVNSHTPCYFDANELVDIADYYTFKGQPELADEVIDYALHLHPEHTDVLISRSRSLALKGKLEEAYQVANLINDPTDREVFFLRADLLLEENRFEEVEVLLTQLAFIEDYSPETLTDILTIYLDTGQKEAAVKWFHELETRYSLAELTAQNQFFRDTIATYYCHTNDYEHAIPLLKQILDDSPYSIEHWIELGRCYLQTGNLEAAHEAIDFALAIDDNDSESLHLKALCTLQSGNSEKACTYFKRLIEFPEKQAAARLTLSKIYQNENLLEASLEQMQALFEIENKLTAMEKSELYAHYAMYCALQGKKEEGDDYLQKALERSECKEEIQMEYGRFYLHLYQRSQSEDEKANYWQEADSHFQQGLRGSTNPEERLLGLLNVASSYFDIQEYASACKYFEVVTQEFPSEKQTTYFFLIYGYLYLQDSSKTLHYLAKMRKEFPQLYEVLGSTDSTSQSDTFFMMVIQNIKENIKNGKIDLDKYL